jgi:hypothetical protein
MPPSGLADLWCERRDSNPHGVTHWNLNPARLPVPPLSRSSRRASKPVPVPPGASPTYTYIDEFWSWNAGRPRGGRGVYPSSPGHSRMPGIWLPGARSGTGRPVRTTPQARLGLDGRACLGGRGWLVAMRRCGWMVLLSLVRETVWRTCLDCGRCLAAVKVRMTRCITEPDASLSRAAKLVCHLARLRPQRHLRPRPH